MQEDKNHIDYVQLISTYLSGNASDSEVNLLEEWVLSSPENKAQFNALKNAWILSGMEKDAPPINVEQEWQAIEKQLFFDEKIIPLQAKPRRKIVRLISMAAAAVALILGSVWVFQIMNNDDFVEVVTQNEVEEGQLPDGTQIALNQYSSVKYTHEKDQKYRQVALTGDAFFEVERDPTLPFVITAEDIEIEVLGTAFYVDAREGQSQVQVIVQSGLVAVTAGTEQVVLAANEIGIYDKPSGELTKKQNQDVNYMAWKTDILVFENTTLESVVFDLNRKFHSNISIANPEIAACEINTTFEHKSLDAIVKIIEKTLNITSEINGEEIIFTGKRCE